MDFTKLFKKDKQYNYFIVALLIIYIIFNVQTPDLLAHYIDTLVGKIAVVLLGLSVFMHADKLVGILTLVAAYELIKRSARTTGKEAMERFVPSETRKCNTLNALNQFPVTLEEQIVSKLVPLVGGISGPASYKPVMNDVAGVSAPVHYKGVI
jgi:hypothetical protein